MLGSDSIGRARQRMVVAIALSTLAVLNAGCGSDEAEGASEQAMAEQLVAATRAAGVAPRLTVQTAEALYGADAPAVCEAFDGELSTSAENLVFGRLGLSRRKTITDDAVTYGRLVVETYCPDQLADFDRAARDLDPIERSEP